MAKKKAIADSGGASEKCPGCGKKCLYLKQWDNGDFFATHTIVQYAFVGKNGISYRADRMGDCCDRNGPVKRHG